MISSTRESCSSCPISWQECFDLPALPSAGTSVSRSTDTLLWASKQSYLLITNIGKHYRPLNIANYVIYMYQCHIICVINNNKHFVSLKSSWDSFQKDQLEDNDPWCNVLVHCNSSLLCITVIDIVLIATIIASSKNRQAQYCTWNIVQLVFLENEFLA